MPQAVDARTPSQLAQLACRGPEGWRCSGSAVAMPFAAAGATPIIPASWKVPRWEIDGQNSIGCASDANSGTSATCVGGCSGSNCPSGVGPLRTCQELITHRWGCYGSLQTCARLQQDTTVEWVSSDTTDDVCYFAPALEAGDLVLQGAPTTVCSGTLSGKVPKSRTAPGQLFEFTLCAGLQPYDFVLNTSNGSAAYTFKNVSGNTWSISQPLLTYTVPWNGVDVAEDDTWANGNSYVVERFPSVNLAFVQSYMAHSTTAPNPIHSSYVYHLNPLQISGQRNTLFASSTTVTFFVESKVDAYLDLGLYAAGLNSVASGSIESQSVTGNAASGAGWKAGIVQQDISTSVSSTFEADAIVTGTAGLWDFDAQINGVYIDTGEFLVLTGNSIGFPYPGLAAPFVWGPGVFSVDPPGTYLINEATAAPTLLLSAGNLQLNGLSTGCSATNAKPAVWNCGITLSGANIDAAVGAAGFGGAAIDPIGAAITTLSSPF